jgi:hypothetical protein
MSFSTDLAAGFARGGVQPPAEGLERAGNHTPLEIELSLLFFFQSVQIQDAITTLTISDCCCFILAQITIGRLLEILAGSNGVVCKRWKFALFSCG